MERKDDEQPPGSPVDAAAFERNVMTHIHAAFNLARWLTRDERDAEDLVQDACVRALRFIDTFRGGNSRAWLLAIVRNTYYSTLKKNRPHSLDVPLDDNFEEQEGSRPEWAGSARDDLVRSLERDETRRLVRQAITELPEEFREVIVLRELEDLSYQDIARVTETPIGTVMSRLSRARKHLYRRLQHLREEAS